LPVSLDCPFLIAPSIFSNVYIALYLYTLVSYTGLSYNCSDGYTCSHFHQCISCIKVVTIKLMGKCEPE